MTVDSVLKIVGWIAAPIFSFIIGWLISRLRESKNSAKIKEASLKMEYDALKETCKYMLKKSLKDDYDYYVEKQGWCSVEDKAEVEKAYRIYSDPSTLNGNGTGTRYYHAIIDLPEHPTQKEE